jgi:hypothetical protein
MLRADQVVDLKEARQAVVLLDRGIQLLDLRLAAPEEPTPQSLPPYLEATRKDLVALSVTATCKARLGGSRAPLREALLMVLELLTAPASLGELAALVRTLLPTVPELRNSLHNLMGSGELLCVRLEDGRFLPVWTAIDGVRLRLIASPEELTDGVLALEQHLPEFLLAPGRDDFSIRDARGRDVVRAVMELGAWGHVVDVGPWLKRCALQPGDDVVLAVRDFRRRSFQIEHQPAHARDETAIAAVTRALSDALVGLLTAEGDSLLYLQHVLPPAWLRVPAVKLTAPEPLSLLVMEDGRMELCGGSALRLARPRPGAGPGS